MRVHKHSAKICQYHHASYNYQYGLDDTKGVSRGTYVDFLTNNLNCFPSRTAANRFYSDIRCGILHQAQSKPHSALTFNNTRAIEFNNSFLMVSVDGFVEEMNNYFLTYRIQLQDINNTFLRINFIKKMNFICNRWS